MLVFLAMVTDPCCGRQSLYLLPFPPREKMKLTINFCDISNLGAGCLQYGIIMDSVGVRARKELIFEKINAKIRLQ